MTPIEIIALILIIFSFIKILVLAIKPKSWMNFAKMLWANIWLAIIIYGILAIIVLNYLLQELTIVQILAVIAFVALFMGVGLGSHVKDLIKIYEKQISKKILWKDGLWFYVLLWIAILIWGIITIFK